jgi:2'-5' RNA ligase
MSLDTNPIGKGYALWLMPAEPMFNLLAGEIARLSREYVTPQFDPHVTLLGGITLPEEDTLARSAALAGSMKPFQVELGEIGYLDEYFRSLFIRVVLSDAIIKARQSACEVFGHGDKPPYMPHVSLVYGKLELETKKRIVTGLGWLSDEAFDVRSIGVYRVNGPLADWKYVERFELR